MRHFTAVTDRNYLAKFLVLHESLLRNTSDVWTLHLLAADMETLWLVDGMKLENVEVMPLSGFEQAMNLAKIKESRNWKEYMWTMASNLIEYWLPWTGDDGITYLDSDLMFFSDPSVMFEELGNRSIAIIPHRLIPSKKHLEINGVFNVGWLTIRNTETGRRCIKRWAEQVRSWCFDRVEGSNACGDQKFLDEWPGLYGDECCIIQNIGANLAPWNLANYRINWEDGRMFANKTGAVFFHAHEFKDEKHLTNYLLRPEDMEIYQRYIAEWTLANERIAEAERKAAEQRQLIQMEAQRA